MYTAREEEGKSHCFLDHQVTACDPARGSQVNSAKVSGFLLFSFAMLVSRLVGYKITSNGLLWLY